MLEGISESERTPLDYAADYVPGVRQRWSDRVASFACGFATLTLLPLSMSAPEAYQLSLPALAGVIVASLMLGAGLSLHLRFASERIGANRLRGILLVLLSWSVAALGAANWSHQFLAVQLLVGILAASVIALGAPGLPALLGAAATVLVIPPLFKGLAAAGLGDDGGGAMVASAAGVFVLLLAGVSHLLTRTTASVGTIVETAPAVESQPQEMPELPAAAAA